MKVEGGVHEVCLEIADRFNLIEYRTNKVNSDPSSLDEISSIKDL